MNELGPESTHSEGRRYIEITLEIGENQSRQIRIFSETDPEKCAFDFCQENNLEYECREFLVDQITKVKENNFKEDTQNKTIEEQSYEGPQTDEVLTSNQLLKETPDQGEQEISRLTEKLEDESSYRLFSASITGLNNRNIPDKELKQKRFNKNVFTKLYNEAATKRILPDRFKNKNWSESEDSFQLQAPLKYVNMGEIMYNRGLRRKEETLKKTMQIKSKEESKIKEECTFRPKMQDNKVMSARSVCKDIEKVKTQRKERLDQIKQSRDSSEMRECSFRPKISGRSKKIASRRASADNYLKPLDRKKYIDKHKPAFDFKPKINESTAKSVIFSDIPPKQKQKQSVEKKAVAKPERNVFAHLFNISRIRQVKQNRKVENEDLQAKQDSELVMTNKSSVLLHEDAKFTAFQRIFNLLDGDEDGLISREHINLERVEHNILLVLEPLLEALEQNEVPLAEDEFVENMFVLFDQLIFADKKTVLTVMKHKKNNYKQYSFKVPC